MQTILLTGGCGFIGSHCAVELIKNNYNVIIVDNLINSSIDVIDCIFKITNVKPMLYQYDIKNENDLNQVFSSHVIDAVIHFAGYKSVSESVQNPLKYYDNNVSGLITLLKCMSNHQVTKIIFSSSATVYGNPQKCPITEDASINILNPYGQSKYISELILKDQNIISIILRYFNPVGGYELLGENPNQQPTNLFPVIISVYNKQKSHLDIFGSDYNTHDGTPIRDYIHVVDLAKAHVKALAYRKSDVFNLGTGKGYTVLEVVKTFENYIQDKLPFEFKNRRLGDAESVYADCSKAKQLLNWEPIYDLTDMVKDTVLSHVKPTTTTFVTAFCLIENYVPEKTLDAYFNHFKKLVDTGINIAIYVSSTVKNRLLNLIKDYPNVKLMDIIDVKDTWVYQTAHISPIKLPSNRNPTKDTFEYMVVQNSKIEYCYRTIQKNPFNTEYFSWIDFGIFHVFKNESESIQQLKTISTTNFIKTNVIFPGCWRKNSNYLTHVNWRFCGGFFLGHQDAILDMWIKYQDFFKLFLRKYNIMLWEVNIWAAMEYETDWIPIHYQADHNDSIINIPHFCKI